MGDTMELLKQTGMMIDYIVEGIKNLDEETRLRIMEKCGEACAESTSLNIAEKIAEETEVIDLILFRANKEIPWCGKWVLSENKISSTCVECGCPLVRHGVVNLTETFCLCSRGWVKTIFEVLLRRPVDVELRKAIGRGDDTCRYDVYF